MPLPEPWESGWSSFNCLRHQAQPRGLCWTCWNSCPWWSRGLPRPGLLFSYIWWNYRSLKHWFLGSICLLDSDPSSHGQTFITNNAICLDTWDALVYAVKYIDSHLGLLVLDSRYQYYLVLLGHMSPILVLFSLYCWTTPGIRNKLGYDMSKFISMISSCIIAYIYLRVVSTRDYNIKQLWFFESKRQ